MSKTDKSERIYAVTHLQHDHAHCLAPGLFRSLKRGDYKRHKLDTTYEYSETESLRFTGFEPLGGPELRLLQVVVALAGPSTKKLDMDAPETSEGVELIAMLEPAGAAKSDMSRVVDVTLYRLLIEMGVEDTGPNRKAALESLYRLANVTVKVTRPGQHWTMNLLGYRYDQNDTGHVDSKIMIAINGRLTVAAMGGKGIQYVRIEMGEVRAIKSDPTRFVHQHLCAWLKQGASRSVGIDTLCGYAWPDGQAPGQTDAQWVEVMKTRRRKLKECIAELTQIGWKFDKLARSIYTVTRPEQRR